MNSGRVLRFPKGIDENHPDGDMMQESIKLVFETAAMSVVANWDLNQLRLKISKEWIDTVKTALGVWITTLVMNPETKEKKARNRADYTTTFEKGGVVYFDVFPIMNDVDDEGYFVFSYRTEETA